MLAFAHTTAPNLAMQEACAEQRPPPLQPTHPPGRTALCRRVLDKWVSRFDLWPYLERFTIDATKEILAEMGGKPDFIIGNYRCWVLRVCACFRVLGLLILWRRWGASQTPLPAATGA